MAEGGGKSTSSVLMRDYRKGNWTVGETMVLIEAKKMDDERRMKRSGEGGSESTRASKPAELRWKWVEEYCWKKGCLRSQNQCNDKWDNLMRDYKKVREYERKINDGKDNQPMSSYWKLEKSERKERNLPTNMVSQIYEALVDVVEKRELFGAASSAHNINNNQMRGGVGVVGGASVSGSSNVPNPNFVYVNLERPNPPLLQQQPISSVPPIAALPLLPPPPLAAPQPPPPPALPYSQQPMAPVDSDTSEHSDSPAKRRRRASGRGGGGCGGGDQGTSGGTVSAGSSSEVGAAISRGASMIAEALQGCEEREERRHRDLMSLHERRLQIEESKSEINRQGIHGLIDAINKLANSIQALASNNNQPPPCS